MNICGLREFLRKWFAAHNVCECPEFPAALRQGAEHPDILISLFDKQPLSLCIFQMLSERSFCNLEPLKKSPGLIWLVKPFATDFFKALTEFLTEVEEAVFRDEAQGRFCLAGALEPINTLIDRASIYKILLNGIEVGECKVVTSALHENISQDAAIVTLNLGLLLKCRFNETVKTSPEWVNNLSVDYFAALSAFPGPRFLETVSDDEVIKKIDKIVKDNGCNEVDKLNRLIFFVNHLGADFGEREKVRSFFCSAIGNLSKIIAQNRNISKSEKLIDV